MIYQERIKRALILARSTVAGPPLAYSVYKESNNTVYTGSIQGAYNADASLFHFYPYGLNEVWIIRPATEEESEGYKVSWVNPTRSFNKEVVQRG